MSNNQKVMPHPCNQSSLIFDDSLLARVMTGEKEAIFDMGVTAFDANKLGVAISFFKLADREGHPEALKFINLIREIAKTKNNLQ